MLLLILGHSLQSCIYYNLFSLFWIAKFNTTILFKLREQNVCFFLERECVCIRKRERSFQNSTRNPCCNFVKMKKKIKTTKFFDKIVLVVAVIFMCRSVCSCSSCRFYNFRWTAVLLFVCKENNWQLVLFTD